MNRPVFIHRFPSAPLSFGVLLALSPVAARAEDLTVDGVTYKDISVLKVEPDALRISHRDGVARVPYEQLPEKLREKYGFDPEKAAAHRERKEEEKAAKEREVKPEPKPAAGKPAADAPRRKAEDPQPPKEPPREFVTGKTFGIAEALENLHRLDGKTVRLEVIVNSQSKIESVDRGLYRVFVGDALKKSSDYAFLTFDEEGMKKMRALLKSQKGKMSLWVDVYADDPIPFHAVGRTLHHGSPGQPSRVRW